MGRPAKNPDLNLSYMISMIEQIAKDRVKPNLARLWLGFLIPKKTLRSM